MFRQSIIASVLALGLVDCVAEDKPSTEVSGEVIDPEKFLYARLGLLSKALGLTTTGKCYDEACSGDEALEIARLGPSTIRALEDPALGQDEPTEDGAFEFTVPYGDYHFVVDNSEALYLPTIDGVGTKCDDEAVHTMFHGCGNYGMMTLVQDFTSKGVVSVMVMNDAPGHEFLPIPLVDGANNTVEITVTGGQAKYWVFNPTDPVESDDPAWGWQPLVDSPADIPMGMMWIGMISIVNPTGDTVHVEITDLGTSARPAFTYAALDLPVKGEHYTFAEAFPK